MADFTPTQGRYLAFIHAYIGLHGYPPAESEIAAAMCVSPPSVNQMVKTLEKKGLILRQPGQPRALQILIPEDEIPPWNNRKQANYPVRPGKTGPRHDSGGASGESLRLVGLPAGGPVSEKFANKENQPRDRNPRRPDARTTASGHLRRHSTVSTSTCMSFSSANGPSIPTEPTTAFPTRTKARRDTAMPARRRWTPSV